MLDNLVSVSRGIVLGATLGLVAGSTALADERIVVCQESEGCAAVALSRTRAATSGVTSSSVHEETSGWSAVFSQPIEVPLDVAIAAKTAAFGDRTDPASEGLAGWRVVVLELGAEGWEATQVLPAPNADEGFGAAVALLGNRLVVGAPERGTVHIYSRTAPGSAFVLVTTLTEGVGFGRAVTLYGDRIAVGWPEDESVHSYETRDPNVWIRDQVLRPPSSGASRFGQAVALDDERLLVGAPGIGGARGEAFLYDRLTSQSWLLRARLDSSSADANLRSFGAAVAIERDLIAIGAPTEASESVVHLRKWSHAVTKPPIIRFAAPASDALGSDLALSDGRLLVGATGAGEAYLYDLGADLSLTPSPTPATVPVGGVLRYQVTITNHGPGDAERPIVTFELDPRVEITSSSLNCAPNAAGASCTLEPLQASRSASVFVTVRPVDEGELVTVARVVGVRPDRNPGNEEATFRTYAELDTDGDGDSDRRERECGSDPNDARYQCKGCTNDLDGDQICDEIDACPDDPDNDVDGDQVCGDVDVCPEVADPDQADRDDDGFGDACDLCPDDPSEDQRDVDGDGIADACDVCRCVPDPDQADEDGDRVGDACDRAPTAPVGLCFEPLRGDSSDLNRMRLVPQRQVTCTLFPPGVEQTCF